MVIDGKRRGSRVAEEDYDFMLFVWRVLENPGRRAAFYRPKAT
jgi:hypothetical protein